MEMSLLEKRSTGEKQFQRQVRGRNSAETEERVKGARKLAPFARRNLRGPYEEILLVGQRLQTVFKVTLNGLRRPKIVRNYKINLQLLQFVPSDPSGQVPPL